METWREKMSFKIQNLYIFPIQNVLVNFDVLEYFFILFKENEGRYYFPFF